MSNVLQRLRDPNADLPIEHPFSVTVFLVACLGVAPYNLFVVARGTVLPTWALALVSLLFLLGAALTSIPAGAALKRIVTEHCTTLPRTVIVFSCFLVLFVIESTAAPALREAYSRSVLLSALTGASIAVQLLVTSFLQKIVWDQAVKLIDEQSRSKPLPPSS